MEKLTDESPMPFGKHKGVKMANVPASYLLWIYEQGYSSFYAGRQVNNYVKENMDSIQAEIKTNQKS